MAERITQAGQKSGQFSAWQRKSGKKGNLPQTKKTATRLQFSSRLESQTHMENILWDKATLLRFPKSRFRFSM